MPDLEKVIRGLESCIPGRNCGKCPYHDLFDKGLCNTQMEADALALLREQEARVMTIGEVTSCNNEGDCLWLEAKECFYGNVLFMYVVSDYAIELRSATHRFSMEIDDYLKTWRLWTARPTDDQRRAAKWDA